MTYIVDDRFHYVTDSRGRIVQAKAELEWVPESARRRLQGDQTSAGGPDRLTDDEGGHLFAAMFGAPGEAINLIPQARMVNRSEFRVYENDWRAMLRRDPPDSVIVDLRPRGGDGQRPALLEIRQTINGSPRPLRTIRN